MKIVIIYILIANIIVFAMYGIDKYKAKNDKWRISENTLILACFLGGAYGGFLGMQVWHHKTKKTKFKVLVPIAAIVNSALILAICEFQK